ncbi:MAG: DUF2812 domain-containing protein [Clostridia bacterium]|nr:DUF2812 domain-containing protein [Clostridia bacterium]
MSEKNIHRICPCDSYDIEGIQNWLEDMAQEGLLLTKDNVFCDVFTFEKSNPQRAFFRLIPAKKPRLLSTEQDMSEEEKEVYHSNGFEYLLKYGEFHILRTSKSNATELNTDSNIKTLGIFKKTQRNAFISAVLMILILPVFTLRYSFRCAVLLGAVFILCVYGIFLYETLNPIILLLRLKRYKKRLLTGDTLTHRKDWKKSAPLNYCKKGLHILFFCGIVFSLIFTLVRVHTELPLDEYPEDPPFATLSDTFPDGVIAENNVMWDYGTARTWKNLVSTNIEWNENCDITTKDGEDYHCILLLDYHETANEWLARGLEEDYYIYDSTRFRYKHFEDLDAPDLGVESVRVYNSYGSLYVLMREGNRVIHATVVLRNDTNENDWQLWAKTMAEMLK